MENFHNSFTIEQVDPFAEPVEVPEEPNFTIDFGLYDIDMEDEDVKAAFRRMFCTDERFLKKYGPINSHVPVEGFARICKSSPNHKCAFMTCMCFEETEDDFLLDCPDWYTGVCEECKEKISSREKAFRIPLTNGGFKYCLCSRDCAHSLYSFNYEALEHELIEIVAAYLECFPITFFSKDMRIFDESVQILRTHKVKPEEITRTLKDSEDSDEEFETTEYVIDYGDDEHDNEFA